MFCRNCGKEIQDEWVKCPYCEEPLKIQYREQNSRNRIHPRNKWKIIGIALLAIIILTFFVDGDSEVETMEEINGAENKVLSYNLDEDLANELLYYNENGQITDAYGNIIPEYSNYVALEDGTIISVSEIEAENTEEMVTGEDTVTTQGIPENPNDEHTVDGAIYGKMEEAGNSIADGFLNKLIGWGVEIADDEVDKRNISMYYGKWTDKSSGISIYISSGVGGQDYSIDLSSLGYGKNINGTFTSSQTIYMGDLGMGIVMNEDGSVYVEHISITDHESVKGTFVKD